MIVYTPQATLNAGGQAGIETKIANAVAQANQAYLRSNVDMQINLVHTQELNYVETGDMTSSLIALTDPSDGNMDERPCPAQSVRCRSGGISHCRI